MIYMILGGGLVGYVVWRYFRPPADAVGSYVGGWDKPDSRKRLIKLEADQDHDLRFT